MELLPGEEQLHVIYSSALQSFVIVEPLIYVRVCHGTLINKN